MRRTKGWRMPADTVYVGRPSVFGNPFRVGAKRGGDLPPVTPELAVRRFERWLMEPTPQPAASGVDRAVILERLPELAGKNLACWCPLDSPCHADVLLRLANEIILDEAWTFGVPPEIDARLKQAAAELDFRVLTSTVVMDDLDGGNGG